jgi:hypothetical protein
MWSLKVVECSRVSPFVALERPTPTENTSNILFIYYYFYFFFFFFFFFFFSRKQIDLLDATLADVRKTAQECVLLFKAKRAVIHSLVHSESFYSEDEINYCPCESKVLDPRYPQMKPLCWDMYNPTEWAPSFHLLFPKRERIVVSELFLLRKLLKSHPLAQFDVNLLKYLFSFILSATTVNPFFLPPDVRLSVDEAIEENRRVRRRAAGGYIRPKDPFYEDPSFVAAFPKSTTGLQKFPKVGANGYDLGGGQTVSFGTP